MQWSIIQLERQAADGLVITAHWRCEAAEDGVGVAAYGSVSFTPDEDAEGYIPFEDLTQADVLEWVYSSVDKEGVEENLLVQSDAKLHPTIETGLPWAVNIDDNETL